MCADSRRVGNGAEGNVIRSTGSGKSSLFYAILGELCGSGVQVSESVSVAFQEPWVFQGTVLENIVMGGEVNKQRYMKAISAA